MTRKRFFIICFFILLTVLITYPAIFHVQDMLIGDGGDSMQFLGFQNLAKRLFFRGEFPFGWTNLWRYPYGVNFQNIADSTLFIVTGLGLYQFFSDPVVVYNLTVFIFIFLNLSLSYASFRYFFSPLISLIGAILFGLSFYSIARLGGHMNLFLTSCFPFFCYAIIRVYRENGSKKSFVVLCTSLLLVAFSSLQYPLIIMGSFLIFLPILLIFLRTQSIRFVQICWGKKTYVLIGLLFTIFIFSLFHGQKLMGFVTHDVQMPVFEITSVPFINFFLPNHYLKTTSAIITNSTESWIENVLFFGYFEVILFIAALTFLKKSKLKTGLIMTFFLFLIFSLGKQDVFPQAWPYQYIFPFFPFRAIIEPGRFSLVAYLSMTILILILLKKIDNKIILYFVMAFLILERLPVHFALSPNISSSPFITAAQKTTSKAILNLPTYSDWLHGQKYDFYSSYIDKPMVNAYVQWSGNTPYSQTFVKELEDYSCQYAFPSEPPQLDPLLAYAKGDFVLKMMNEYDIRTLIIHKDLILPDIRCQKAEFYIHTLLEAGVWKKLYEDADKVIYWLQ